MNIPNSKISEELSTTNYVTLCFRTDYPCYREYVIAALPQLETLDGSEITRTERFKAQKNFEVNRREVIQLQVNEQLCFRTQGPETNNNNKTK